MFFTKRFFIALATIFVFFLLGYVLPVCFTAAWVLSCILFVLTGIDVVWGIKNRKAQGMTAHRICPDRFSNGDENEVRIAVENHLSVPIHVDIIDELPDIFQRRDILFPLYLKPGEHRDIVYHLRPVRRGVYGFGRIRLFVTLPIGLVTFRLTDGQLQDVKVYPPTSCSTATSSWPRTTT